MKLKSILFILLSLTAYLTAQSENKDQNETALLERFEKTFEAAGNRSTPTVSCRIGAAISMARRQNGSSRPTTVRIRIRRPSPR